MELKGKGEYVTLTVDLEKDLLPSQRNDIESWLRLVANRVGRDLNTWFLGTGTGLIRRVK